MGFSFFLFTSINNNLIIYFNVNNKKNIVVQIAPSSLVLNVTSIIQSLKTNLQMNFEPGLNVRNHKIWVRYETSHTRGIFSLSFLLLSFPLTPSLSLSLRPINTFRTMAAAFRILHFPPTNSHFSHNHLPPPPNHRLLLSLATKRRKSNLHLALVKHNAPLRALPSIQSESAQENTAELEQEVSKTRLLVSNVPWTSTADDIRSLFQNYGTVVDIEVV